jgi:hypothetical protein
MREIGGEVYFQHMKDIFDAAVVLEEAGFDTEIIWQDIDDDSDSGSMKVTRYVDTDTAPDNAVLGHPALKAFYNQVSALVDPFGGELMEWGFEGLPATHSPRVSQ